MQQELDAALAQGKEQKKVVAELRADIASLSAGKAVLQHQVRNEGCFAAHLPAMCIAF